MLFFLARVQVLVQLMVTSGVHVVVDKVVVRDEQCRLGSSNFDQPWNVSTMKCHIP